MKWKFALATVTVLVAQLTLPQTARAQSWTRHQVPEEEVAGPDGSYWYFMAVASSANGAKLAAVGLGQGTEDSGPIFTSSDAGVTWQKTSAPPKAWLTIASSADGFKLIGGGYGGVYTSIDSGANWSARQGPPFGKGVASSADGTKLVAVGAGIVHSIDGGVTWQFPVTHSVTTNNWTGVASSADGTMLVAVGTGVAGNNTAIYLSSDSGNTWSPANVPKEYWTAVAASADGRKLVATAAYGISETPANYLPSSVFTSADYGATWTRQAAAPSEFWTCIASSADGTKLVAGGQNNGTTSKGQIYTSNDSGVTWLLANNPPTRPNGRGVGWLSVASSADGNSLVALPNTVTGVYTLQSLLSTLSVIGRPPQVRIGDKIQVVVTARNNDTNVLTNVQLAGPISVAGSGQVSLFSGPTPAVVTSVPPGQLVTFTNIYLGTNTGKVTFTAATSGHRPQGVVTSSPTTSDAVAIVPKGDLLVKRAAESADLYAGLDLFQKVPIPPQIKTNVISSTNDVSTFQIQIRNDDPQARDFTLLVNEGGNPVWKRTFLMSGADVTGQIEAPGGMILPSMAAGTALTLTVSLQDTNASVGDVSTAEFVLGWSDDVTVTLDAVRVFTQLAPAIVVNSTADLPLLNPNGCCCDTGRTIPGTNTAECTLRAAIQLANRSPLKEIIQFQIPASDPGVIGGVPSIQPETALPDITDPVIIDGWSQSPESSNPPVELSGVNVSPKTKRSYFIYDNAGALLVQNFPSGLHLVADGCEVRGLVVNSFPDCGILVDGSQAIIQGNYLGTDSSGNLSKPSGLAFFGDGALSGGLQGGGGSQLCLRSPGNLVGGSDPKLGNVISGGPNQINFDGSIGIGRFGTAGLLILGGVATGNVVEGNMIGLDSSGRHTPYIPLGGILLGEIQGRGQYVGVWIHDGSGNRVGSSTPGAGNIIAGNFRGVYMTGAAAFGNVIAGNQIGWSTLYPGDDTDQFHGVSIGGNYGIPQQNTVGGSASDLAGNIIGHTTVAISDNGTGDTVASNWIGLLPDGKTAIPGQIGLTMAGASSSLISQNHIANMNWGIALQSSPNSRLLGNSISNCLFSGISLLNSPSCRVTGNHLSACLADGLALLNNAQGTVVTLNTISGNGSITLGTVHGVGILVASGGTGGGVTISQNSIYENAGLGIGFNVNGRDGSGIPFLDSDGGQPVRMIFNDPPPAYGNGQIRIVGTVQASVSSGTYLVEFFGNAHGHRSGYGEGQTYIGSAAVPIGVLGTGSIDVTFPSPNNPGQYLTATATAADGSTTEFSKAYLIQDCTPGLNGLCASLQANVPSLPGGASTANFRAYIAKSKSFGDGNGDGIQDSLQSNVASFPSLVGLWMTLAGPTGTTLEHVTPAAPPDFTRLPAGYVFPVGFQSFGVTNLPASGTVTITNYLHLDSITDLMPPYSAATYFNYGPTPDNHTPHWYEFLFDGTDGAELLPDRIILHFHDGARGDHDLRVNGEIVTIGAPAYPLQPVPQLSISVTSVGLTNTVYYLGDTNGNWLLTTNAEPRITAVLSWPAKTPPYSLEYLDDLSVPDPTNPLSFPIWRTVVESSSVVDGRYTVTNTMPGSTRFFQLRP